MPRCRAAAARTAGDDTRRNMVDCVLSAASPATLCVQSTAAPVIGSFPRGAESLMESYEHAASRHFADAEDLAARRRLDNAGHLIGLAAECAVKHAVRRVAPNPPHIHFPNLTAEIRKFGGRDTVLYKVRRTLSSPALGPSSTTGRSRCGTVRTGTSRTLSIGSGRWRLVGS